MSEDRDLNKMAFSFVRVAPRPGKWYLNTLGNQANLDIDDRQVIDVELMRRGIRKRGIFGLIGSL